MPGLRDDDLMVCLLFPESPSLIEFLLILGDERGLERVHPCTWPFWHRRHGGLPSWTHLTLACLIHHSVRSPKQLVRAIVRRITCSKALLAGNARMRPTGACLTVYLVGSICGRCPVFIKIGTNNIGQYGKIVKCQRTITFDKHLDWIED